MVRRKGEIQTTTQKAVTFSKRRKGLFNKAAELCMLSGCQVAILVSSPVSDETLYSFGHPSTEVVFDAYLNNHVPVAVENGDALCSAIALYNKNKDMEYELDQKAKNKKIIKRWDETDEGFWWDFEELGDNKSISELQVIVENLEKLREMAFVRMNSMLSSQLSAPGSIATASSSSSSYSVYNGNNNNKIGIVSASNYACIDENYVCGVNNNTHEADLGACKQEAIGLENNSEQDFFENLLNMDFEVGNNGAAWFILNDAMNYSHQNFSDCAVVDDQNYHSNPADHFKPIASTANEFEQVIHCNKS